MSLLSMKQHPQRKLNYLHRDLVTDFLQSVREENIQILPTREYAVILCISNANSTNSSDRNEHLNMSIDFI